jgi:hypothetical protein
MRIKCVPFCTALLLRLSLFHVILFADNAQTAHNVHCTQNLLTGSYLREKPIMFQRMGLLTHYGTSRLPPQARIKACTSCRKLVSRLGISMDSSLRKLCGLQASPRVLEASPWARRSKVSPGQYMKIINGASGDSGGVDGVHVNGAPRRDTFDPTLYEAAMLRERWADDSAQRAKSEPTSGEVGVSFPAA